jgi:hypothetical protein
MKDQWPEYWVKVCATVREHYVKAEQELRASKAFVWTRELPTALGYYWAQTDCDLRMVEVSLRNGELVVYEMGLEGFEPLTGLADAGTWWLGPFPVPPKPEE